MTLFFNVTDAVGADSQHGITRTERQLASALSTRDDVAFVEVRAGRLYSYPRADLLKGLARQQRPIEPHIEWFGREQQPPPPPSFRSAMGGIARASRRSQAGVGDHLQPAVQPADIRTDDVVVSVGLDWVHDTLSAAERAVYADGGRYVGMCYDTIPIDHPEWVHPPDPIRFGRHLARLGRVANKVMCISHTTQRDYLRHVPVEDATTSVIRLGSDATQVASDAAVAWATEAFGRRPYAIYCATVDRRKNHATIYRAAQQFVRRGIEGMFVFVGKIGSGVDDLLDCMRFDRSIDGRIALVTHCDDDHLAALYNQARFAVYPSLYEGWGLGVTEALAHGKPCIIASGSALGEAGLDICPEIHPLRTGDWVDLMESYFLDPPSLPPITLPTWQQAAGELVRLATQ
jgi:glycosyltransferase involved in cell wall biosynthesis